MYKWMVLTDNECIITYCMEDSVNVLEKNHSQTVLVKIVEPKNHLKEKC